MPEKDIKYINFAEEHVKLLQNIQDLGLVSDKHDLMRVAVLIGLKVNPEYKLNAKIKNLLSRSENDGVLNIHKNQLDDENYLAYMVNKFAPDDNGNVYRKIQALAYAGFEEIKSNFLNDDFTLNWDEIKKII